MHPEVWGTSHKKTDYKYSARAHLASSKLHYSYFLSFKIWCLECCNSLSSVKSYCARARAHRLTHILFFSFVDSFFIFIFFFFLACYHSIRNPGEKPSRLKAREQSSKHQRARVPHHSPAAQEEKGKRCVL